MSGGAALTRAQCNQLEEYVRNHFVMVERMTAGSRGCVFKVQADDGTFYIKKFMDREDYANFNAVRGMFQAKNLRFDDFHAPILAEGQGVGLYFVDMAVGDKVTILDDDTIANMLGTMHDNNLFHGDIFRVEEGASSFQEGSVVYKLNHANAVKMEDGSVRLIDFGNQYNQENPLVFERKQLQSLEKGINVYNNRRLKTAKRRQEEKRKRKQERQEEGGQRKKRQIKFLEGLIQADKKQKQETINGGACRIVSSEKHQCVRECQPSDSDDASQKQKVLALLENDPNAKKLFQENLAGAVEVEQVAPYFVDSYKTMVPADVIEDRNVIFQVVLKDQSYLRDDAFFNSCAQHGIRYINFINQTIDRRTLIDLCVVALKLEEAFVTEAVDVLVQCNKINLPIASVEDFIEACERIELVRLENKPEIQEQLQVLEYEQEWVPLERDLLGLLKQQEKPSLQEFKNAFANNGKGFPEDPNDVNWPTEDIEEVYRIFLALEPNQEAVGDFMDKEILGEKHQCDECQPTSLQDFARKLRHFTEIHPSTLENYILWRRTEQRANQVARQLGANIPDRSLPATWYDNIVHLFGKFDEEQASGNFTPKILMEDEPEGDAGIYEPIHFETLEQYEQYRKDYYKDFKARIRPKDPTSKWCVIYFRQHLVVAKLEANKIVVYNSSDSDFLPLYEKTWGDMANSYFDTELEVEVIHLDVQGVNDCGIWVHMIPLYETDILNSADPKALFEGFIKHF